MFLLLSGALSLSAQKVAIDDEVATVDGTPYCRIQKTNCKLGACDLRIATLDGTEIIFIKLTSYNDPATRSAASPEGRVVFYDWTFLSTGAKAETDFINQKNAVKAMVDARLLKDGAIDETGERNFIAINGKRHSQRQEQLGLPVIIIQR